MHEIQVKIESPNTESMRKFLCNLLVLFLLSSCASTKKKINKKITDTLHSKFYDNQFTGLLVVDAHTKDTLFNYNSDKYFTPASNTKIFTLYTALQLLPQKMPALNYIIENDTLYIEGTGDPTLLHPFFKDSTAIHFINKHANIALNLTNFQEKKFGPGWSWDDYHWYYSAERSAFPLYGNVLTLYNQENLVAEPEYLAKQVIPINYSVNREQSENLFYFDSTRKDTLEVPFIVDTALTLALLQKAVKNKLTLAKKMPEGEKNVLYGLPSDSVYKRMMQESDNFLAEQLLIVASSTLSDTLSSQKSREHILKNQLSDLQQPPRWVDGSGLSRYNLFSPKSMVDVLSKMYSQVAKERLFVLFPAGGVSGTLKDWYPGNPDPYIYAKTGSLGNNHCVSGYLLTKSGKTLIFSFMNNHFRHSSSEEKQRMQVIFEDIRDNY